MQHLLGLDNFNGDNFKVNNIYCDKCWTGYGVITKHKRIKGKHGKWAFFVWQG
jgi:hypothetical protein